MDLLAEKADLRNVRRTLKSLPINLSNAHRDMMERIDRQEATAVRAAYQVLSWIVSAVRPLTIAELRHALAIEPGEPRFDKSGMRSQGYLLTVCGGLVVIESRSTIVRLVHYSTEEYIQATRQDLLRSANATIASSCLTYLSYKAHAQLNCIIDAVQFDRVAFTRPVFNDIDAIVLEYPQDYPFYQYAAQYWGIHAQGPNELDVQDQIFAFFDLDMNLLCSVQSKILSERGWPGSREYLLAEPIHRLWVAAQFGLTKTVRGLLLRGASIDQNLHYAGRPFPGPSALQSATINGHLGVVQLLLDSGANHGISGDQFGSPVLAAAYNGHMDVLRLLLDSGANPSPYTDYYGTAVGAASLAGQRDAVELLLQRGASIAIPGVMPNGQALQFAAMCNREAIVKLLIDSGANVDEGYSIHERFIRACREQGDSRGIQDRQEEEAWSVRWRISHQKVFQVRADDCESPLQCASLLGHYRIAEILLENNASVNNEGLLWGTPLQAASFVGDLKIARLLIKHGAKVNADGYALGDALQAACIYGNEKVVNLLLEHGATINSKSKGLLGNALQTALIRDHKEVLSLLLKRRHPAYRTAASICHWIFLCLPSHFRSEQKRCYAS
jgi:ankyrin repeat protein